MQLRLDIYTKAVQDCFFFTGPQFIWSLPDLIVTGVEKKMLQV